MLIGGKRDGCSFTGGQYNASTGRAKYATWYSHDIAHGMERREAVGRTTDGREGSPDTRVAGHVDFVDGGGRIRREAGRGSGPGRKKSLSLMCLTV